MRTLAHKFIFGLFFLFLIWKGFDGLLINFHSGKLFEADIREIEIFGTKENRFLKIKNGIAVGTYIYGEASSGSGLDVI
jgi:hypothetical protein